MSFWLQLPCTLLLGKCFCPCFVVSQFAITQPFSSVSVPVPSLPHHPWVFWCLLSQPCSFDQGKCGSQAKYTELFLIFHN